MTQELAIYMSAAPEADSECELVGQLLAGLLQSARWNIKRTPTGREHANPDLDALARSQFYLILLGSDIVAPMGVELRAAQAHGVPVLAYRGTRWVPTPAASAFAQQAGPLWRTYTAPHQFIRDFERRLIGMLIEGTPGYGLAVEDLQSLAQRMRALEGAEQSGPADESRRGAGHGGVILPASEG